VLHRWVVPEDLPEQDQKLIKDFDFALLCHYMSMHHKVKWSCGAVVPQFSAASISTVMCVVCHVPDDQSCACPLPATSISLAVRAAYNVPDDVHVKRDKRLVSHQAYMYDMFHAGIQGVLRECLL
jgi:hypothetical protein